MAFDPAETQRRLDELLARAADASPDRPIDPGAPLARARRTIRIRYALLTLAFVALVIVLTAGAVVARNRVDGDDDATGPTGTGSTGPTATGTTATGLPVATIDSGPRTGDLTNVAEAAFGFTIEPPQAGAICTMNGARIDPCESPLAVTAQEGENTFTVSGVDAQDRVGEPASRTWTLDTEAPTLVLTSVELVYAPTVDDVSCSVDLQPRSCTDPVDGLSSGQHAFLVRLPYDWDLTWILSSTPPRATFVGTGDTDAPETSTVRFSFDVGGAVSVECVAGDSPTPCDQGLLVDSVTNTGTQPITRTLEIVAIDEAENRTSLQFSWSFDAVDTSVD